MNPGIQYHTIPPPPALAPYVRFFWIFEGEGITGSETPYVYRSMADGCVEMLFHYKGIFDEWTDFKKVGSSFTSGIHGQSQQFRRFIIHENFGIFGVYLYPFALPVLFSMPATEVSNEMPNLKTFMGKAGADLEEKIMLAGSHREKVNILSGFLEKQLVKNQDKTDPLHRAVREIIRLKGEINIFQLAKDQYLSIRQFQRRFKEISGFSPKLYARIIRFNAAMNMYGHTYKNLTDIAYKYGYYDQSHFIHDFKEFSGYHPKQYFSGKAEGIEWRES